MLLPHAGPFFCIDLTYRPPSAPTLRTMPTPASSARESSEPNILRDYGGRIHAERERGAGRSSHVCVLPTARHPVYASRCCPWCGETAPSRGCSGVTSVTEGSPTAAMPVPLVPMAWAAVTSAGGWFYSRSSYVHAACCPRKGRGLTYCVLSSCRVCWATILDLQARLGTAEARLQVSNDAPKASVWAELTQPVGVTLAKIQDTFHVVKWRCASLPITIRPLDFRKNA